jgi:hydroxymethylglutaryl-CoA reductase
MPASSHISGFYNLSPADRRRVAVEWAASADAGASVDAAAALEQQAALENALSTPGGLGLEQADKMVENVVATYGLPLGIATNFVVNGRDVLVPMVIEEPSVVAGASFAARLARAGGGFTAESSEPLMIGQMQVLEAPDLAAAAATIIGQKQRLVDLANSTDPVVVSLHGGARDIEVRTIADSPVGPMLVVHLLYDCRDAMGANMVNTACEALSPLIQEMTGGRVNLRILSNLADRRLARASCVIPASELAAGGLSGELVARRVVEAYALAAVDPYRAATHNKGIMNGVDAVVLATGNDWRAIEAGSHAYASRDGLYRSLSTWSYTDAHDAAGGKPALIGSLELPMAVGIVGGATRVHPLARFSLKLMHVKTAGELAQIIASVGLAQNFAAIRALATEGIQRGHMALHARQVAAAAGATPAEVDRVAAVLISEKKIRADRAVEVLAQLRSGAQSKAS